MGKHDIKNGQILNTTNFLILNSLFLLTPLDGVRLLTRAQTYKKSGQFFDCFIKNLVLFKFFFFGFRINQFYLISITCGLDILWAGYHFINMLIWILNMKFMIFILRLIKKH